MLSHVFIGVCAFDSTFKFYSTVMVALGHTLKFCEPARPWAAWVAKGQSQPLFLIGKP